MNLPPHRRIDYGRTHSSPYRHWCGIEHQHRSVWPRALRYSALFLFAAALVTAAITWSVK